MYIYIYIYIYILCKIFILSMHFSKHMFFSEYRRAHILACAHPRAFNRWRHFSTKAAGILITSLAKRGG